MGEFKKLNVKIYDKKSTNTRPDVLYWKTFSAPVFIKEFGPIDYIDFSPKEPHYFAVTSSVRVQVYSPITRLLYKNLSRFQKNAFGASFRSDGKLLCSGGEEAAIKLFDVASKSLLRVFKGHSGPVHRCFFSIDNTSIASFSDDGSVGQWDIPGEKRLISLNEHNDYVRAGAVSPVCPATILSGGYDHVVKMYDTRSQSPCVFTVRHDAPVESVLFLPTGGIFLSAGGTEIRVWDAFAGGRLLTKINQHHKTVTCMCVASKGSRFLSGGLDRHVNVYDVSTFSRLQSHTYPNSVLSVGISANDETLAVGMVDGLVSIRRREAEAKPAAPERRQIHVRLAADYSRADLKESSYESDMFNDGGYTGPQPCHHITLMVGGEAYQKRSKHEMLLKKFDHTGALNSVLMPYHLNKMPQMTATVLRELLARQKLHVAVAGAEPRTVLPLLRFIIKYIGDARFTRLLLRVADVFLDVYENSIEECGAAAVALFKRLDDRVQEQLKLTQDLLTLQGSMDMLLSAAKVSSSNSFVSEPEKLTPSVKAQGFVVNVN